MPILDNLSLLTLATLVLVMCFAGLVHGTLGLGFPLIATPLLALVFDVRSAILLTLLPTVTVNLVSIVKGGQWRRSIGRFWPLAGYAVCGSLIGTEVLIRSDPAPFKLLLAGLVLLYLATARISFSIPWIASRPGWSMLVFGLVAGFSAGTTNVMVPILIIYFLELGLAPTAMVQVFNLCFVAGKLAQIAVFGAAGLVTAPLLTSTAPLALAAVVALALGMRVRERLAVQTYHRVIRYLLFAFALLLVAQFFGQLLTRQ